MLDSLWSNTTRSMNIWFFAFGVNYLRASVVVDLYETLQQIRRYISQNSFKKSFGAALFATLDALLSTWAISSLRKSSEFFRTFSGFIVEANLICLGNWYIREPLIDLVYKQLKSVSGEKNIDQSKRVDAKIQTLKEKKVRNGMAFTSILALSMSMLTCISEWIQKQSERDLIFAQKYVPVEFTVIVSHPSDPYSNKTSVNSNKNVDYMLKSQLRQSFLATVFLLPLFRKHFQLKNLTSVSRSDLKKSDKIIRVL